MNKKTGSIKIAEIYASNDEMAAYKQLSKMLGDCPIPTTEILGNLALFLTRSTVSHILLMDNIYRRIIKVPGVVIEFGVRWGRNMALLSSFRSLYEPYNFTRKIIGFDTFQGIPNISDKDGNASVMTTGALSVSEKYKEYLDNLLTQQERLAPRSNIRKYELVKGDVSKTFPNFIENNPETVISLAYFDLTTYEPTKKCLSILRKHMPKGSMIVFDDFALNELPGETIAFKEELGLTNYKIERDPSVPTTAFVIL